MGVKADGSRLIRPHLDELIHPDMREGARLSVTAIRLPYVFQYFSLHANVIANK
jgi:hypothetical protein